MSTAERGRRNCLPHHELSSTRKHGGPNIQRRVVIAAFALASAAFSQTLPSYQLIQEIDASGMDSVAGLGTDAQGNVYIAGTTYSQHFPVKNAIQPNIASSGLYRISGTAATPLGLVSCSYLAVDAQNPSTIYAVSKGTLLKSVDGGVSFAVTSLTSVFSIAILPGNDQVLFAGSGGQGVLKSTDGGATWNAVNNGIPAQQNGQIVVQNIWIDPTNVSVIFAETLNGPVRSADGGASWQPTTITDSVQTIVFDTSNPGVLYANTYHNGALKSIDYGQTFTPVTLPKGIYAVIPDTIQPGRLIGFGSGLYQSTDGGLTFTQESTTPEFDLVADTMNGVYYAAQYGSGIIRISADLQTVTAFGPALPTGSLEALAVVNGQLYEANFGGSDVFITKLDPAGEIVYSTYVGGTGSEGASAMTVDAAGNVFVAGTTSSSDFPVSKGAYATSGNVFLFRLNPDGSLGYSTYFSNTQPVAVATDGAGSAWLLGNNTYGMFPVTPGALATKFCCAPLGGINIGPPIVPEEGTLTRFAPSGSSLTFSTYLPGTGITSSLGFGTAAGGLAVAPDGSAYVGAFNGIFRIDSTGSTLLASMAKPGVNTQAMALGSDGSVYAAGPPENLQAGILQSGAGSNAAIVRIDAALKNVLAATNFGLYAQVKAMTIDAGGDVYIGGTTASSGLPTRTPFAGGFANPTGFMSELSPDLSSLLFSSYFGDTERFTVSGIGIGLKGSVWIGGATNQSGYYSSPGSGNVWVNNIALTPPPPLRIDSVENAASLIDGPIAAGETIVVNGAGFGSDAQLMIGGAPVVPISMTPTRITATVPGDVPALAAAVEVQSGGASTNSVLMPVAAVAPGIFSQNGSGSGQGYILNKDGTLNSPSNPAAPGDPITIFATGVGPLSFTECCAVAQYPVNVYINGVYCYGVYAIAGPVNGLPGNVYQITVYVPDPAVDFPNAKPPFVFPPLDRINIQADGVSSQPGITISIAQ